VTNGLRVGVLGGAGFIGSRLVEKLSAQGCVVSVGDIAEWRGGASARGERCDVRELDSVERFMRGLEVVYNLAAEHRDDVWPLERYHQVNVAGARNVCEAAARCGVRSLIFTSSVAVYGIPDGRANEAAPLRPFNEYGRTKLEAEGIYRAWAAAEPSRRLVIVRPTVVFGKGNRGNVYGLVRQIVDGRFVMVGDGLNQKSLAYVENVSDFLAHVRSLGDGVHTYNYADGPDLDMNSLVRQVRERSGRSGIGPRLPYLLGMAGGYAADVVARLTGRNLPISSVRVKKFCGSTRIDASALARTGFVAKTPLVEALDRFLSEEFGL
jgi:nucleoside-diphosphate-sugar epimerase